MAAPDRAALTGWGKFRLVVKVVEFRLRFVALMAATGLTFAYWDTLANRYDKWMRPARDRLVAASAGVEHYCPMHPAVVQAEPGQCPICGMPLARRKPGEKAALPDGVTARVQLASGRVAQGGIRTAEVGYAPLAETLTTVGSVAVDERRRANVVSKAPGRTRVEVLHANVTGMEVKAGEPLAELYSPELAQAVAELRAAQRSEREAAGLQTAAARSLLGDRRLLVTLAAEKLRRWGITPAQVDALLRDERGDAARIPILAPIGGTLIRKNVVEGQEVAEGEPMFEVADLGRVWVLAQVYEHQIGLIRTGQAVAATVPAYPGREFPGRVAFIQPTLDPATRTVEVRFDLDNPDGRLRPGMFATVTLRTPVAETPAWQGHLATRAGHDHPAATAAEQGKCPVTTLKLGAMGDPVVARVSGRTVWACCDSCLPKLRAEPAKYLARLAPAPAPRDEVLSVPEAAVIDTGDRRVVYVEAEPGVFEGRVVTLGPRVGDRFPVLDGLAPGDRVAAAGAFLIDAESRLNPGPAPAPAAAPSPPAPAGPPRPAPPAARSADASGAGVIRR